MISGTCDLLHRCQFHGCFGVGAPTETSEHPRAACTQQQKHTSGLTTVETDQTAEVSVSCFLLHPYGVCIAHSCQIIVENLEWTFRRV